MALLIAHLAEVDARRLFAPAGHPSMFVYCVEELHFSEDCAYKRIRAARAARQFPELFTALADGRLHLAALALLAPHLTVENVSELIEAATHRSKTEIDHWLARRFAAHGSERAHAAVIRPVTQLAPGRVESVAVARSFEERYSDLTIPKSMHDKLRRAQSLLSHTLPSGDVVQVLDRALDTLIAQLETRKLGSASPRARGSAKGDTSSGRASRSRYIPAPVRRAVWERDRGQCTFVTHAGHRCSARRFLEFDHIEPVARGGETTVEGLRLRCRTHNQ